MKKILFILILLYSQNVYAKRICIFLYTSEKQGDLIYENITKDLGFNRKLSIGKNKNIEYHVTLGFIENVEFVDAKELRNLIKDNIKFKNVQFEFGIASLLGKNIPYIVALPKNVEVFQKLNMNVNHLVSSYKSGKYVLSDFTKSDYFIPHMSLNSRIFSDIKLNEIVGIINSLNKKMINYEANLSRLVVKIE